MATATFLITGLTMGGCFFPMVRTNQVRAIMIILQWRVKGFLYVKRALEERETDFHFAVVHFISLFVFILAQYLHQTFVKYHVSLKYETPCPPLCTIWDWRFCMLDLLGNILHGKWQRLLQITHIIFPKVPKCTSLSNYDHFTVKSWGHFFCKKSIELRSGR